MADPNDITAKYLPGVKVPYHLEWYFVLVSCVVSYIGAQLTLELLHRRWKAHRILQTIVCAISFGLVAIWCMHFVGNRAIVLGDGEAEIQLYYNPGFTAISVFLAVVVVFLGFHFAETYNKTPRTFYASLTVTGFLSGSAIVGMHYVGNIGTSNYSLSFDPATVVGAVLIAITACAFSFSLFFRWKELWITSVWRRVLLACLLMSAVSGMHWTAAYGTTYTLKHPVFDQARKRNINMIIALAASLLACVVCGAIAWSMRRRQRKLADRAQRVVLASVIFDEEGKLLVTTSGQFPCEEVTQRYNQRSFNEEFNTNHAAFQWLFRVSHHWTGVIDLVPGMRQHLRFTGNLKSTNLSYPERARADSTDSEETETDDKYSAVFREQFCVAASDLAHSLGLELKDLGVLYENIMMTATVRSGQNGLLNFSKPNATPQSDPEAGLFGKGQWVFVTRTVDKLTAADLQRRGYTFVQIGHISDILARGLSVKREEMSTTMRDIRTYVNRVPVCPDPGIYIACYTLLPVVKGGWKVLVEKDRSQQLPMIKLAAGNLTDWQTGILKRMNGKTLAQCCRNLESQAGSQTAEGKFMDHMRIQLLKLVKKLGDPILNSAEFYAQAFKVVNKKSSAGTDSDVTIFAFCFMQDPHNTSVKSEDLKYIDYPFFTCQQRVHPGCEDHWILTRRNHMEFAAIKADRKDTPESAAQSTVLSRFTPKRWRFTKHYPASNSDDGPVAPDSSSEKHLVGPITPSDETDRESASNGVGGFLGGIMVHKEVHHEVTVEQLDKNMVGSNIEMREIRTEAGVADAEGPTFAELLFAHATKKWSEKERERK